MSHANGSSGIEGATVMHNSAATVGTSEEGSKRVTPGRSRRTSRKLLSNQGTPAIAKPLLHSKAEGVDSGRKAAVQPKVKQITAKLSQQRSKPAAISRCSARTRQPPVKLQWSPPAAALELHACSDELHATGRKRRPSVKLEDSLHPYVSMACERSSHQEASKRRRLSAASGVPHEANPVTPVSRSGRKQVPTLRALCAGPALHKGHKPVNRKRLTIKTELSQPAQLPAIKQEPGLEEPQALPRQQEHLTRVMPRRAASEAAARRLHEVIGASRGSPCRSKFDSPAVTRVGRVLKLKWSGLARKAPAAAPPPMYTPSNRPAPTSRLGLTRKAATITPRQLDAQAERRLEPYQHSRRSAKVRIEAPRQLRQVRRSLFRNCKLAVSLAKQLASDDDTEDEDGMTVPAMTIRTRSAGMRQRAENGLKSSGPPYDVQKLICAQAVARKDLLCSSTQGPSLPRLIVRLKARPTQRAGPSPAAVDTPTQAAERAEASECPDEKEVILSRSAEPVEAAIQLLPMSSQATDKLSIEDCKQPSRAVQVQQTKADTDSHKKRKRAAHPAGSIAARLNKQCRLFPELPPKLISPTRTFSVSPVTRCAPDGEPWRGGRLVPAPQRKPAAALRQAPKRLLPKSLLRQARSLASRQLGALRRKMDSVQLPRVCEPGKGAGLVGVLGALAGGKPIVAGKMVDMERLGQLVASAKDSDRQQLWEDINLVVLQHSVQLLLHGLCTLALPSASQAKLTAGISYVLQTSSKQHGVEHRASPLPHTVIRPPVAPSSPNLAVHKLLNVLKDKPVAAAVMPLRDDAQIKQYLLDGPQRSDMACMSGGEIRTIAGTHALDQVLTDRVFVCIHYHLGTDGVLRPCFHTPATTPWHPERPGIADSNVQIGLIVRRGVGGTCPARLAGRRLRQQGLLPALLDLQPPVPDIPVQSKQEAALQFQDSSQGSAPNGGPAKIEGTVLSTSQALALTASAVPSRAVPEGSATLVAASQQHSLMPQEASTATKAAALPVPPQQLASSGIRPLQLPQQAAVKDQLMLGVTGHHTLSKQPGLLSNQYNGVTRHNGASSPAQPQLSQGTGHIHPIAPALLPPGILNSPRIPASGLAAIASKLTSTSNLAWQRPLSQRSMPQNQPVSKPAQPLAPSRPAPIPAPARYRREKSQRRNPEWQLAEEEGFDELLEEVDTMLRDPTDPDYDPSGAMEESSSSSSDSEGEQDSEHRAEGRAKAARGVAARMLAAGHLTGHPRLRLYTRSCRLEMYVSQSLWDSLDSISRSNLMGAVKELEVFLGKQQLQWNRQRLLSHAEALQKSVGSTALDTPLAHLLLRGAQVGKLVKLELIVNEHTDWPVSAKLIAVGKPISRCPASAGRQLSSPSSKASALEEVGAVCTALVDKVCRIAQAQPPVASQCLRPYQASLAGNRQQWYCPKPASTGRKLPGSLTGAQTHSSCQAAVVNGAPAHGTHAEVAAVLHGMLDELCTMHFSGSGGLADSSAPDARRPQTDAELMQEHNGLLALASAVATAAGSSRSVLGDFPWPFYFIGTRDCFTYHLVTKSEIVEAAGRSFTKTQYYFPAAQTPENYDVVVKSETGAIKDEPASDEDTPTADKTCGQMLPAGITTYTELFTEEEMQGIEGRADLVDCDARAGNLPIQCFHNSQSRGGNLKRTKFFFGARYLWTHEQLSAGASKIAGGVRVDVPPPYGWMKGQVEAPLVQAGLLKRDYVDSWALNLYHDGSEGIQSHFDDAGRFQRPITSLRLMSDSRLSFGTQLYGYTNGAFYVDMPRGCITVMEEGGYAATGLKHCVRPVDMTGRSAALIMRKIMPQAMADARALAVKEAGEWLAALTLKEGATPPSLLAKMRADAAAREQQEANVKRDVWRVLDSCIRNVEVRNRPASLPRRQLPKAAAPPRYNPLSPFHSLSLLVSQVERLVQQEVQQAAQEASEVQCVVDQCVASIERICTPRHGSNGLAGLVPSVSGVKALPVSASAEATRLLQIARQLLAQLAPQTLPLSSLHFATAGPPAQIFARQQRQLGVGKNEIILPVSAVLPPSQQHSTVMSQQSTSSAGVAGAVQGSGAGIQGYQSGSLQPSWLLAALQNSRMHPPSSAGQTRNSLASAKCSRGPPGDAGKVALQMRIEIADGTSRIKVSLIATPTAIPAKLQTAGVPGTHPRLQTPDKSGMQPQAAARGVLPILPLILPLQSSTAQLAPALQSLIAGLRAYLSGRPAHQEAQQPLPKILPTALRPPSTPQPTVLSSCSIAAHLQVPQSAARPRPTGLAQLIADSTKAATPAAGSPVSTCLAAKVSEGPKPHCTASLPSSVATSAAAASAGLPAIRPAISGQEPPPLPAAAAQIPSPPQSQLFQVAHSSALVSTGLAASPAELGVPAISGPQLHQASLQRAALYQHRGAVGAPPAAQSQTVLPPWIGGAHPAPIAAVALWQNELVSLIGQLQAKVSRGFLTAKAKPMKASQYRALAKSASKATKPPHRPLLFSRQPAGSIRQTQNSVAAGLSSLTAAPRKQAAGAAACWSCFKPTPACPVSGTRLDGAWSCGGPCRRSFHEVCEHPAAHAGMLLCFACHTDRHTCSVCGKPGNAGNTLTKCSMSKCGLFYHYQCAVTQPLTHPSVGGSSFRCPQHYCSTCGRSGDSIAMVHCMKCSAGYHCRCRPLGCRQLTKKLVVCDKHAT